MSFAASEWAGKKKQTKREKFLGQMEEMVPWSRLVGLIKPHYPKGKRGTSTDGDRADAAGVFFAAVVWVGR